MVKSWIKDRLLKYAAFGAVSYETRGEHVTESTAEAAQRNCQLAYSCLLSFCHSPAIALMPADALLWNQEERVGWVK